METWTDGRARVLCVGLVLAAVVLVAACGSTATTGTGDTPPGNVPSDTPAPPSGAPPTNATPTNTTPTDAGATPANNTAAEPTPTNTAPTNTSTTPTNTTPANTTPADTTPTSGTGASTQPAPNPCDGLLPTFGAPTDVSFPLPAYAGCPLATSSPWGQLVLGRGYKNDLYFDLYSASGENQGRISGMWANLGDLASWFSWTSDGYVGLVDRPPQVSVWDNRGARVANGPMYALALAPDGAGGTVALTRPGGTTQLWWLDSWAHRIRSVNIDGSPSLLLVAWGTHHVVTIETGGTIARARWYDGAGAPLTGWVELGSEFVGSTPSMHLLVDGSVALATGGRWRVVLRDGAPTADPAPVWLAELSSTRLATIRGGTAYAALGVHGSVNVLDILTPDGQRCATLTPPLAGDLWWPARLDVGQDGTLIEIFGQSPRQYSTPANAGGACMFRWWSGLLR